MNKKTIFLLLLMLTLTPFAYSGDYRAFDKYGKYQGFYRNNPYNGHVDFYNRYQQYVGKATPGIHPSFNVYNKHNMYRGQIQVPKKMESYKRWSAK